MPVDFFSDCDCPHCSNGVQSDSEWNLDSRSRSHDSLPYQSGKKSKPSHSTQNLLLQDCFPKLEDENEEDPVFVPTKKKSSKGFSQKHYLSLSPEDVKKKLKPLRELTIQDLLKEFGDCGNFQPNCMSLGHLRDQVVMKFRRALYYSGIWVKHVQGCKLDKQLTANYFKTNPGCLHRLVPWLKRELTAVYGNYGYTVKNILDAVLHHMTEYDLDSDSFIHLLEPYLLQHTHHFLHEFITFVRSPYNIETYDQRAIYQYTPTSTWVQNKPRDSAPVYFWPEGCAPNASQHDTKQSQNTQVQWNSEERPRSGKKLFPNGHSSFKNTRIPLAHQETADKSHICTKDKLKPSDHKGIVSNNNNNNNMVITWATLRKRVPGYKHCAQEKKEEGMKLFPGHDLHTNETTDYNFSIPEMSNEVQPPKFTAREEKAVSTCQKIHLQTKEGEENKCTKSSPKSFRRCSRGRSLTKCRCRERDRFWSCPSEKFFSPMRSGRKLSSHRKKRKECRRSPQVAKFGSHFSRRTQRQSKCSHHRSKSWTCVEPRKRSLSREVSNRSLGESCASEHCCQHMCCRWSRERNAHSYEANNRRASLSPFQLMKLPSTCRKKPDLPSKCQGASPTRSTCSSLTGPQTGIPRSLSNQEMKPQILFPQARNMRYKKTKCQFRDSLMEVTGASRDLGNEREGNNFSEYVPFCRRQIQNCQNSCRHKHGRVKKEQR
ncbi:E3 ubiquitin-protein ligase Topors-like [Dipodomys merriami]|uniref:E3 ubiquitin-protein ligase Topors-like n=1 Tax=Dipodomys merriami TaxID=94247 RepID=UPI00384EA58F